ncbi:hypothetical protein V6N12_018804 [Hibiscus sabdariffa]
MITILRRLCMPGGYFLGSLWLAWARRLTSLSGTSFIVLPRIPILDEKHGNSHDFRSHRRCFLCQYSSD